MLDQDIKALETRVERLIQALAQLSADNRRLRGQEIALKTERDELQRKNELAKARVEAIILRLRALEQQTE